MGAHPNEPHRHPIAARFPMTTKVKIHDGIIGGLILATSLGSVFVDARFAWLGALTAAIMVSSAFTGFCPVHYTIGKLVKD